MHAKLRNIIRTATASLTCRTAKGREYAAAVIAGRRTWSGADLQGNAKRYGRSYADRRGDAANAVARAGGCVVAVGPNGRLATAVIVCTDDYGDTVYATTEGLAVPRARASRRLRLLAE